jgi:hypothetical protein
MHVDVWAYLQQQRQAVLKAERVTGGFDAGLLKDVPIPCPANVTVLLLLPAAVCGIEGGSNQEAADEAGVTSFAKGLSQPEETNTVVVATQLLAWAGTAVKMSFLVQVLGTASVGPVRGTLRVMCGPTVRQTVVSFRVGDPDVDDRYDGAAIEAKTDAALRLDGKRCKKIDYFQLGRQIAWAGVQS